MAAYSLILLMAACYTCHISNAQPVVTLSHGGQLRGRSETFQDVPVDLFTGVRYAEAPVGDRRLKKPRRLPAWQGIVDATSPGNRCPQIELADAKYVGDEDCLFMDILVPGGVQTAEKKPVMLYIHGGGLMSGTGICYVSGSIAVTGDVIVITINYRIGVLGFLSTTKGTGNYGLWDQREALLWVRDNIAHFGGDPDLVTIFGQSAGGASVSSQLIGQHNDGLFKRGIAQSGTAFMMFDISPRMRSEIEKSIREQKACAVDQDLYECMEKLTAQEIVEMQLPTYMVPTADDDFFSDDTVENLSYELSHRFDVMAGVNKQEGGLFYEFELRGMAEAQNKSVDEGVDYDMMLEYINFKCLTQITPLSPQLCTNFIVNAFGLNEEMSPKERAFRVVDFLGEQFFNADTANQLEQHSVSDKATYGYYFTELHNVENPLWQLQDWLKRGADHGDELPLLFGAGNVAAEAAKGGIWKDMVSADALAEAFISLELDNTELSVDMMKMWTNFARTGNPNLPQKISSRIPTWPEFTPESNSVLELNTKQFQVVSMPNRERLEKIRNVLMADRQRQMKADLPQSSTDEKVDGNQHDEL
ncbi:bile salt-activated lipase-like isoform X2 [Watersipora subatra]|uniref:bile salt-activated lipase-like isoform X2 n=1 Tax=Watersipora subatra TaxID=2589382 RepID=UPI00355B8727